MLERIVDGRTDLVFEYAANPNCVTKASVETGAFMRDARTKAETPLHRADGFTVQPDRQSTLDHGMGWGVLEASLLGTPHL